MNQEPTPAKVRLTDGLGPLIARLRACADDPMWATHAELPISMCAGSADTLDAAHVVGIRQEQIIMDHEREIARLRGALELAAPALELGCDALRSEAERYHAEMAGYRPHRHQEADDAYKQADFAWQAVVAALEPNAQVQRPTAPAGGRAATQG